MNWGRNQLPALTGMARNANSGQSTDVGAAWADASLRIFPNVEQLVPSINTSLVLPNPAHSQPKFVFRVVHTGPGSGGPADLLHFTAGERR